MKNKILARLICLLTICFLIIGAVPISVEAGSIGEAQSLVDDIISYKQNQLGASSVQSWINGSLSQKAGKGAEWYILALSQYGNYDFSSYQTALKNYLKNNEEYSATSRQKYALCLITTGSTDSYITSVLEDSIGQQGVMSWIYGLHLLNNGYTSSKVSSAAIKQTLLSLQLEDGGWAVTGSGSDVDVTAMAVQALAYHYRSDSAVKSAVDEALTLLSSRQLESGDYASYGVPNPESTAQVITALSALGIDCQSDSRFIKNGNTLFDGMRKYQLTDGSFCHKAGGGFNETATVQAFYSMVSYIRMENGKSGLYILDNRNPSGLKSETTSGSQTSNSVETQKPTTNDSTTIEKPATNDSTIDQKLSGNSSAQGQSQAQLEKEKDTATNNSSENEVDTEAGKEPAEEGVLADNTDTETDEETEKIQNSSSEQSSKINVEKGKYKIWTCVGIGGISLIVCSILYLTKKRNKKNFIAIFVLAVVAALFVSFTDFQSTEDYYHGNDIVKANVVGTVTLTIRCDTIVGKSDSEYIPADGIILDTTEFAIEEQDTVYEVLTEAAQKYSIQMENTGAEGMVYIAGINYLYEFDFGDLSGWMYHVNGEAPSVGCDEYILSDGDNIEWMYTCELGKDLE